MGTWPRFKTSTLTIANISELGPWVRDSWLPLLSFGHLAKKSQMPSKYLTMSYLYCLAAM